MDPNGRGPGGERCCLSAGVHQKSDYFIGFINKKMLGPFLDPLFGSTVESTFGSTFGSTVGSTFGSNVGSTFGSNVGSIFGSTLWVHPCCVGPLCGPDIGSDYVQMNGK